jgi:hypothetical protein
MIFKLKVYGAMNPILCQMVLQVQSECTNIKAHSNRSNTMEEKRAYRGKGNPAYTAMSFRMSPETKAKLKALASRNTTSASEMVKTLIEDAFIGDK